MPQASCPTCGAPLSFRPGTMVAVCEHCKSISARTDRDPRLIGQVADLVDTGSTLALGMEGRLDGRGFTLAGRTQLGHPLGGVWDEWYLAFADGRWGWLAQAQGHLFLTFREQAPGSIPPFESLQVGGTVHLGGTVWMISEFSRGTFKAAEGEIPWLVEQEASYPYADLSAPGGAFATLDYSEDPPLFFAGREIALEDLKLHGAGALAAKLKAQNLPCPRCGAPMPLRAPDQTQRVACAACGSLFDAEEGRFSFLKSLKQVDPRMFIPLGAEGRLAGMPLTCIGFLRRACTIDGLKYFWGEYLLLDSHGGFHWLVESDGHWSFVQPIPLAQIQRTGAVLARVPQAVQYAGNTYRCFQSTEAVVEGVYGEFYWKVEQGEHVHASDYVHENISLSEEIQRHPGGGEEVTWSCATYVPPEEVWLAFKLKGEAPSPQGIAPNQPNPHWKTARQMGLWMALALGLLLILFVYQSAAGERLLFQEHYDLFERMPALQPAAVPLAVPQPGSPDTKAEEAQEPVFFSNPIQVESGHRNLALTLRAPVNNAWIGIDGALVNEATGTTELFEVASSYYHGSDSDGPWSEGGQTETVFLSAVPAGTYVLRIAPQWDGKVPPVRAFDLELRSGVLHGLYYGLALVAILLIPILAVVRALAFESRRWQESMFTTSGGD